MASNKSSAHPTRYALAVAIFAVIALVVLVTVSAATSGFGVDSSDLEAVKAETKQDEDAYESSYIEFSEPITGGGDVCDAVAAGATLKISDLKFDAKHTFQLDGQAKGFNLLEGPIWSTDAFYFSRIDTSDLKTTIYKYAPGSAPTPIGSKSVAINGLATYGDTVFAAGHGAGALQTVDLSSATATNYVAQHNGKRFNSPNDLAAGPKGVYMTDPVWAPGVYPNVQGGARLYFIDNDKNVSAVSTPSTFPNGVVIDAKAENVYLIDQKAVYKLPLDENGKPGAAKQISGGVGQMDGAAIDCLGNLYIATLTEKLLILDANGGKLGELTVPGSGLTTNLTFGGEDGKTLLLTTSGNPASKIFSTQVQIPGKSQ
jgi:gluconolactonase